MVIKVKALNDVDITGQKVFIRADMNVPMSERGSITDDTRIAMAAKSITFAHDAGAYVMVTSHLGRPTEGKLKKAESLAPIARRLEQIVGIDVVLVKNWVEGFNLSLGKIFLLENCRANVGEKVNDDALAKQMAALCDIYVNDAFATSHRSEATTHGMAQFAPVACAGPLMLSELEALEKCLRNPERPLAAIVGGSKVSTKLTVLKSLARQVDFMVVGGGIANTFLAAKGVKMGRSLVETSLIDEAREVVRILEKRGGQIFLPTDVICAKEVSENAATETKGLAYVSEDDMVLDFGPKSVKEITDVIQVAGTILWNGPLGVFEIDKFSRGTMELAKAIASSSAFSIAGGGDTIAAINAFGVRDKIDYLSTGGGAFLEFLGGSILPAIDVLEQRAKNED